MDVTSRIKLKDCAFYLASTLLLVLSLADSLSDKTAAMM
jgi:hypothetical protein